MTAKGVETLHSKMQFLNVFLNVLPSHFPPKTMLGGGGMWRPQLLYNVELWGWRYQRIDAAMYMQLN